jgi:hypothetical protein
MPTVRVTVTCKNPKICKAVGFRFFSFWFTDPFVSVLDLPYFWFRLLLCFVAAELLVSPLGKGITVGKALMGFTQVGSSSSWACYCHLWPLALLR